MMVKVRFLLIHKKYQISTNFFYYLEDKPKLYLAIMGDVFDVSRGEKV